MVLLINEVVQPPVEIAAILLLLIPFIRIVAAYVVVVVSVLHVRHFVALAPVVEEDGVADGALALALERR